jgi:WD40 repeat protein
VGDDGNVHISLTDGTTELTLQASNSLRDVAWSSDGQKIVAVETWGRVWIWPIDGSYRVRIDDHLPFKDGVRVAANPKADVFATAGRDGDLRLYSFAGDAVSNLMGTPLITSIDANPHNGQMVVGSEDRSVRFWQPDGSTVAMVQDHESAVTSVVWHPHADRVASADYTGEVRVFQPGGNPQEGYPIDADGMVDRLRWSRTGDRLAGACGNPQSRNRLVVWDVDGNQLFQHEVDPAMDVWWSANGIEDFCWSPDDKRIAYATPKRAAVWDVEQDQVEAIQDKKTYALAWQPQTGDLALGINENVIILPESEAGARDMGRSAFPRWLTDLSWHPAGEKLLGSKAWGPVQLWSREGETLAEFWHYLSRQRQTIRPASCWTPDGQNFFTASFDSTIRAYHADTAAPQWIGVNLPDGKSVTFSPEGKILHGDPETIEEELVYLVETDQGTLDILKPSEFKARLEAVKQVPVASTGPDQS